MSTGLTGHTHRDTMKIRHHEHQEEALLQIRNLRGRIEELDKQDIAFNLDKIQKELDDKIS